jgi:TolA-binding protein
LTNELTAATAALQRTQARIKELEPDSGTAVSENQTVDHEPDAELTARITTLERDLAESRIKLQGFDEVNRQLLAMEQRYEKLKYDKQQLEDQRLMSQHQYEHGNTQQHLHAEGNGFEGVEHSAGAANRTGGSLHSGETASSEATEIAPIQLPSMLPSEGRVVFGLLSDPSPGLDPMDRTSLTAALAYLEAGRYEEALRESESLMMETPVHREARLCHLLASVHVNSAEGYETQIDSIKDMLDLNDSERSMAREIFLARAELAQNRGCDAEVLRYQHWSVSVVSHEPFGKNLPKTVEPADATHEDEKLSCANSAVPAPVVTSSPKRAETHADQVTRMPRTRSMAAVVGLTSAVLLAIFALFSANGKDTTALRSDGTGPSMAIDEDYLEKNNAQSMGRDANSRNGGAGASLSGNLNSNMKAESASEPPSVSGSYKIVKSTAVFNEPSEQAALVASIEKGTQINVIALRDGWFEIRSKHGRPSGFIRRETAMKLN